jgi:hypothetical protein
MLPKRAPSAARSSQAALLPCAVPLSPIVAVFGSVGLELVLVPDTVCEKLVELEDDSTELDDDSTLDEDDSTELDDDSTLDEDDSTELDDDSTLDEDDSLLEELLDVSPGQPWLSVRTALSSKAPSYVTKTLPPLPVVRSPMSCQPVAKWNEPLPCWTPWTTSPSTLIQTFVPSPVQIQSWWAELSCSQSLLSISPLLVPLPAQYWVLSAASTPPVEASIALRTRAPDATRPKSFRLFMFVASPSALFPDMDRTYECTSVWETQYFCRTPRDPDRSNRTRSVTQGLWSVQYFVPPTNRTN